MKYIFVNGHKKIYVFLNHRVAYLCWIDAFRKNLINQNALLFHIDHHADFWLKDKKLIREQNKICINSKQKLKKFVKEKLDKLNSDLIVLSMYREIIGDAISVSRQNDCLYGQFVSGNYQTTNRYEFKYKGNSHTFYLGGSSILELVNNYGLLTDRWKHQDVQKRFKTAVKNQNIILDIDLDFFTYESDEGHTWAMSSSHLKNIFQSDAFIYLLNYINVISIALEPNCCGGNAECRSILEKLNSVALSKYNIDIETKTIQRFKL